jgi:hypothetical protein
MLPTGVKERMGLSSVKIERIEDFSGRLINSTVAMRMTTTFGRMTESSMKSAYIFTRSTHDNLSKLVSIFDHCRGVKNPVNQ